VFQTVIYLKKRISAEPDLTKRDIPPSMIRMRMDTLRGLYRWLDDRVRGLSRVSYAVLVGFVSAVGVFAVRLLLPGDGSFGPVVMGLTMAVVYYAFDPNNES
jgi:hypothetical protein